MKPNPKVQEIVANSKRLKMALAIKHAPTQTFTQPIIMEEADAHETDKAKLRSRITQLETALNGIQEYARAMRATDAAWEKKQLEMKLPTNRKVKA